LLPVAPAAQDVPLFRVAVSVRRADHGRGVLPPRGAHGELAGKIASLEEHFRLSLSYDATGEMRPIRRTAEGGYAWERTLTHASGDAVVREERGSESGTWLLDWDAEVRRSFRPLPCEGLRIYDRSTDERELDLAAEVPSRGRSPADEAAQAERRRALEEIRRSAFSGVRVRLRVAWPGRVEVHGRSRGALPTQEDSLPVLRLDRVFDYDFEDASPRGTTFVSRAGSAGLAPPVESQWDVKVAVRPLAPHEFGLSARPAPDGALLLESRVVVGGRDASPSVRVLRFARLWAVRERPDEPPVHELVADWRELGSHGNRGASRRIDPDALLPGGPDAPAHGKWISEHLELVDGLPELGLLYHQVAVEKPPDGSGHSLAATEARRVTASAWCEVRRHPAPATELPVVQAGGPLRVVAEATLRTGPGAVR
jgi:hypothetical protein